jgi:HSP20 family protein
MNTLRRVMDRMWDEAVERRYTDAEQSTYPMALDVIENVNEFVVKASLPGVQPDDLDITFTNDTLTIQGEVKQDEVKEDTNYHLHERFHGKLYRQVRMPVEVDANLIQASFDAGVLTLHLPKAEEIKPKRITIQAKTPILEGKIKSVASKN